MTNNVRTTREILFFPLAIAILSGLFTYFATFVEALRKDKLAYVNTQIEKLYGPLHALTKADDAAWKQLFPASGRSAINYFDSSNPPSVKQVDDWREWMKDVFQPLNMQMETAILNNSQLIIGEKMPNTFLQLIAHIESYKAVMATWKPSDSKNKESYRSPKKNTTSIGYPSNIISCVEEDYKELRTTQQKLVGHFWAGITESIPSNEHCEQ